MFRSSIFLLLIAFSWPAAGLAEEAKVDFAKEIRPLLAKHCLACHGQDEKKRKADLRLDQKAGLLHPDVVVPGKPEAGELMKRITTTDKDDVMPPPGKGEPLTAAQKDLFKRWIASGAEYREHWAFSAPVKPAVPVLQKHQTDVRSPIDAFVFEALEKLNVESAAEASKEVWLRRASLDLTGLPPTLPEMDAFLADGSKEAYEKVVQRLLDSKAYGERMAMDWLDVARYADTYGRHEDDDCITWPYREWVIKAFNDNLPYDQFITWQTAGDLLPNPTRDQMIATCFNRLPQQSNEAGSNPEEFRIEQVADRIRTNSTAFLGLTLECCRCHDHKYDPFTTRDYYSLGAFFNNIDEMGLFSVYTNAVPPPSILLFPPDQEKRHEGLKAQIAALEKKQKDMLPDARKRFDAWLGKELPPMRIHTAPGMWDKVTGLFAPNSAAPTKPLAFFKFESVNEKTLVNEADSEKHGYVKDKIKLVPGRVGKGLPLIDDNSAGLEEAVREFRRFEPFSFALWIKPHESSKRAVVASRARSGIDSACRGFELILEDDRPSFALVHFSPGNEIRIRGRSPVPVDQWTHVAVTYDGSSKAAGMRIYLNGLLCDTEIVRDHLYKDIVYREQWGDELEKDGVKQRFALGARYNDASFKNGVVDEFMLYDCELTAPEVGQCALLPENSKTGDWFAWYLRERDAPWRALLKELSDARAQENEMGPTAVELMVMQEMQGPRRPTHVLSRGQFDQPKEPVEPSTPASLLSFPKEFPKNRLGFAKWLVDRGNPLTSRVAVNRMWQSFFGRGLVQTAEDFGTQGQPPSHPELLDWLAVQFMESGWDVKAFCKEIVLSKTYRQSAVPADLTTLAADPENRWLARGPRSRISAEQVRDLALAASGLLNPEIGGPSVRPYQPEGLWEESGTQHIYTQDHGPKLYRRSLYTFWRRTMPPPSMIAFDAPTREFCKVRREHTATPLQALVLMNDPQLIEAARSLAAVLVKKHPQAYEARVVEACRLLTSRQPSQEQQAALTAYLTAELHAPSTKEDEKALLTQNGESPTDATLPAHEVTATTMMVRMLLGFSETTMKP